MAKRKVADLGEGDAVTTRRSSRRRTAEIEREEVGKTKANGTAMKGQKAEEVNANNIKDENTEPKANGHTQSSEQYWLMKAEPESRFEKGHDIKFSIDDLAAKTEPEPWDGIRAYAARNNLRAMKKGDLAFFYHSSCKVPAIVGIMEIVQEHSPDLTAQDSNAPYYDPKDKDPSNPRWSVVHVEFRKKFKNPITLQELKELQAGNKELAGMQMLKQSRLSVSRVSKGEWEFLMGVLERKEREEEGR